MKYSQLFLLLFILANSLTAQETNLVVYPEIPKQKITSIGGNYCQANYTGNAWDAIGEATLNEFKPSHVRVALPLQFRKEYSMYKGEKILDQEPVISLLKSMKRMKEEYGVSNFTVSVWRVANELVDKPERRDKRRILVDKYDEVIDMLEAVLVEAKNNYGVEVDYFSFNESDGGYMTIFSPEETIRFIKMACERFKKAGLKTKFLWADTAQTKGTVEFATMIAADSTIWKYLGPLCFHSWWSEKIPNNEFEKIAGLAKAWNKEVWCSELGFDAMSWKVKGMNASWDFAFRFAKISHRMMKYAEVSVSLYWTWQNNYALMSADTKTKFPSYFITKHYTSFLNSGTQIVHSTSSNSNVLPICGINKKGETVLQIINLNDKPEGIRISGLKGTISKSVSTTENNNWLENSITGEISQIEIPPFSVNTIVL